MSVETKDLWWSSAARLGYTILVELINKIFNESTFVD